MAEEDTLDTFVAPRYRKQRATPSSKETKAKVAEAAQFAADMVIPQTPMDAGLMLIPGGKIARKAGAALMALDAGDAEASPLTKLLKAFYGARKPIEGIYDVEKASDRSIMGKGLNVSTDPSYPSKWAMRPGSEASVVYETGIPIEKYIQLDATYPPEAFGVLRKIRGRNPLPEGEVTGEQVYQSLRGLPQTLIPDTVLKSGYKGVEYPAQDSGRWFSIYDTEGVKDRLGKKFAAGGSVSIYNPDKIDAIMNSIDAPTGFAKGGEVDVPDMDFKEDPETLRLYKHAMKQFMPNQEYSVSTVSTGIQGRVGGGDLSAGIDMNRMSKGQQDQLMKSIAASYNVDLGDLNLNARLEAPLDAKDVYVGMLNGSIPIGEGRAMLGVQGIKTPYGSDVLGYNAGYSGKVGPGRLNVNVNKPKQGKPSAQMQYQIPFAEGGSVTAYDPDQVDAIANQYM